MHELSGFEQRLALALEVNAGARRPVDAAAIARRAIESGGAPRTRPAIGWRSRSTEPRTLLRLALVAALVAIAVIAGGLLVGAWVQRTADPPSPPPSGLVTSEPAPTADATASTISCAEAQAAAARTSTTWTAGPAPASPSTADTGWIAVWGSNVVPELYLINPETGAPCRLATFEEYPNPPRVATRDGPRDWIPYRGPLVWSPDGRALAFVVVGQDNAVRDLYVWSEAGLAGPLLSVHEGLFWPGKPSWSPDGSLLAVPDIGISHLSAETNIWIVSKSGQPPRPIASGCVCHLSPVTWSPSGERIVATTREQSEVTAVVEGSIDAAQLRSMPLGFTERAADPEAAPYGFIDDETVLLVNSASSRFIGRPIDGGPDRDLGAMGVTFDTLSQYRSSLAPDRSAWLLSGGRVAVVDVAGGGLQTLLSDRPEFFQAGWAPNSRAIGYVLDLQNEDQGVWVVNRDGTGGRRVAAGPFVLEAEAPSAFAWQPVWPRP